MKKKILLILLLVITTIGYSQNFGLGIQASSSNFNGISAKFKINNFNSVQAVATLGNGSYTAYSARYIRAFKEHSFQNIGFQPYGVGMVGSYTFSLPSYYNGYFINTKRTSFAYGIGGGISWSFNSFNNFEISNEISVSTLSSPLYGYNWAPLRVGVGLHYYFGKL